MKKKKGKSKLCPLEKFLIITTFLLVVSAPLMSVFAKSALSKVSYEVEDIKDEIVVQTKANKSLQMIINELASLDNLESIAKKLGLSYTSNSVKTVE